MVYKLRHTVTVTHKRYSQARGIVILALAMFLFWIFATGNSIALKNRLIF